MHTTVRPYVTAGVALAGASLIAVTPAVVSPDPHVVTTPVRLTSSGADLLGDLTNLFDPTGSAGSAAAADPLDSFTTFLAGAGTDLSTFLNGGVDGVNTALDLDNIFSGLNSGLTSVLGGVLFADGPVGSIQNFAYNFVTDIINIPYEWSLALKEYAYALGPAGQMGGVADRIPPGTPADGIATVDGQDYYALGGTGSWWMESVGNTWGWDDGNWPQVDGILSALLPLNWTQPIINLVQGVLQAESIDGSHVNCEFECASLLGYLGNWFKVGDLFSSGYQYQPVTADTVGSDAVIGGTGPSVVNVAPPVPPGTDVIWSNQQPDLSLTDTLTTIWNDWTAPASLNPIEIPNPLTALQDGITLLGNIINDFD
ncbi:MAG: hypothetical protein ACRDTV_05355, partial [Mycobacterium sp.]